MSQRDSVRRSVRTVRETPVAGVPAVVHPEWARSFPWLVQGTTVRGPDGAFDMRLFGPDGERWPSGARSVGVEERSGTTPEPWDHLLRWSGCTAVVHARQVHEDTVRSHGAPGARGLRLVTACDGHFTAEPGVLLAVATADCVPVFMVDGQRREVVLLHAGWRGAAAGVLERGLDAFRRRGIRPDRLHVHLGPSICGACYQVGGEVFAALGLPEPNRPRPIDLRAVLADRAVVAGVLTERVTVSGHCTLCGDGAFFSHRAGDVGRQVGFLGVRR
jgi:polyphenol oxidase